MDNDDTGSYRLAVSPPLPDDGLTSEGKPRAIRYKKQILNELNQELQLEEHRLTVEEICEIYQTDPEFGLKFTQAKAILERDGQNTIEVQEDTALFKLFFRNLFTGISGVLWVATLLCISTYWIHNEFFNESMKEKQFSYFYLSLILFIILILVTCMLFFEEKKTISLFNSFKKNFIEICVVIREGQRKIINTDALVAGDFIEFKSGDRIPADLRLIRSNCLKIDSSEFTGDSFPLSKNPEYSNENPLEAKNLCFYNTLCTEGVGLGVVIATGERTVISRLKNLAKNLNKRDVSASLELSLYLQNCFIYSSLFGLIVFIIALLIGFIWLDAIVLFIGIVLSILPGSLFAIVIIVFNLTVKRIGKKCCLVKDYKAIEALGNVNVIICDKTGTLTQNRLTVNHFWFDDGIFKADNTEDQSLNQRLVNLETFLCLSQAVILCNNAEFKSGQSEVPILKRKTVNGNAIESALLKCMELVYGNVVEKRKQHPKIFEMHFNPLTKIHVTIHNMNFDILLSENRKYSNCYPMKNCKLLVIMKGAPEKIIERCTTILIHGKEQILSDELKSAFNKAYFQLGGLGEQIIGFADLALPSYKFGTDYKFDLEFINFPLFGYRFLGLISMIDLPRPSVPDSIQKLISAGIKIVMATGDHATTAKAIARSCNIITEGNETIEEIAIRLASPIQQIESSLAQVEVVIGSDLQKFIPEQLDELIKNKKELIFARLTPQQKLQIIEAFQKTGSVVAAIGDGINDIPMLKKSDVAICIGANNSLKDQADIFILDNNFSTIVSGVIEGRWCRQNLKKIIVFLLNTNCPQLMAFFSCFLFGLPLPFSVVGILCIDLIINVISAVSLAYEEPEIGLLSSKNTSVKRRNIQKNQNLLKNNIFSKKSVDDGYLELISNSYNRFEKLINCKLITYSYLQIGLIQTFAGFFTYFIIMSENGFWISRLFFLREEWDSLAINDLKDSVGQEWNYEQRKVLEYTCQTGYFFALVICQLSSLISCKTRKKSVFNQGMKNNYLNFALLIQILIALFLIYFPGMKNLINFYSLRFSWLFIGIPFFIIIFLYDEFRKYIIRKNPKGWFEKEIFY